MIYNYIKIAWRNLLKYKLFSFINIIGLSLAIPSALMALIQIVNYYEYDNFHQDNGQIIRIITDEKQNNGSVTNWATSPVPLARFVHENISGVENTTTLVRDFGWTLSNGIKTKNVKTIYYDASFFQLFNFPLAQGTYSSEPNTIVLTHESAQWFFKDTNPIGHILEHPNYGNFKIVGVLKPFNQQKTQFRTDVFVPITNYITNSTKSNDWLELNAYTFLKVSEETTAAVLNGKLASLATKINGIIASPGKSSLSFKGQNLTEISPAKEILKDDLYIQDLRSIYINFGFQLIIILLASLNYINLTLARSMNRSREVGVRKVAGATRLQLIFQFLTESILISYIALSIGLLILWVVKVQIHVPWLTWDIDHLGYLILIFFVFNLILGVVAGASPSLILSSFQPVKVLKGSVSPASFGKIGFRKSLIVVQFAIALIYLFFIGHTYHQINYMASDNENFQRKDILNVNLMAHPYQPFVSEVTTLHEVQRVGFTSLNFGNKPIQSTLKKAKTKVAHTAYYYAADRNFIENMELKFVAGENLIAGHPEKSSPFILVNQEAVEELSLGTDRDAIGKQVMVNDTLSATIIGVVANFCHYDYESKIEPVVFQYDPSLFKVMCLKTNPVNDRKALEEKMEGLWKKHSPQQEMNISWLDTDLFERYYPYNEMQLMGLESIVIFVIAILGLIGILTYSIEKRTKEIGIRKVVGATTSEIIRLMSNDFVKLLTIATAIAIPSGLAIGFYMNTYLVFNDGISYLTMCFLLLLVLFVSLAAVGYFSWTAAQTNPAKTLKAE